MSRLTSWTPERRAAASRIQRQRWAERKLRQSEHEAPRGLVEIAHLYDRCLSTMRARRAAFARLVTPVIDGFPWSEDLRRQAQEDIDVLDTAIAALLHVAKQHRDLFPAPKRQAKPASDLSDSSPLGA